MMEHFENTNGTRQANIIKNANSGRCYKVVSKDEFGNIEILATKANYDTAINMAKEFINAKVV